MLNQIMRWALLPVLVSNLYSMGGVLFWSWSVADVFFWFWCEFVLAGITMFALLLAWRPIQTDYPKDMANILTWGFASSFLYLLFFATLFAGMAYKGEWKSYDRMPQFLADKVIGLLAMVLSYALLLVLTLARPDRGLGDHHLSHLFNRKGMALLGFYAIHLVHGWIWEWTTGARPNLSPEYLKRMGLTMLSLKLLVELGLFDRVFKRRPRVV